MDAIKIIAENKIVEAQAEGAFDNLEGMGKPLHLEEIHPAGEDQYLANHILKSNRFLPVWLENRKILQEEITSFCEIIKNEPCAAIIYRTAIEQLNRRISGYNLRVPVDSLRLRPVAIPERTEH